MFVYIGPVYSYPEWSLDSFCLGPVYNYPEGSLDYFF